MELEDYFDFLEPDDIRIDDIRIKGTRIGIESVLDDYLLGAGQPKEVQHRIGELKR